METMLAENIRRFRKERSLTQEQLSEVLGVTAGAVYKWEAKLSVPDLDLIMEIWRVFVCTKKNIITILIDSSSWI